MAAVGAAGAGWRVLDRPGGPSWPRRRITVAQWRAAGHGHYALGHRGSGDVRPEHTVQAYDAAMGWGAEALEISTSSTSDGVLICMHDLSYDRTTDATGLIHDRPSTVLSGIGVRQPQLGPAWTKPPLPRVPRLDQVLQRYGGHAVLCIEAKRDADYPAMIAMVEHYGLSDSVIVKAYRTSDTIAAAKRAGYPVFAYLDAGDASPHHIGRLAGVLDASNDFLGLPTTGPDMLTLLDRNLVRAAVATGIPVWVYPVHRRSERDYFAGLGVDGMMASSYRYLATDTATAMHDRWQTGAIQSGEMTKTPATAVFAPQWSPDGTLTLAASGAQHYLALGQLAPITHAQRSYRIEVQARWDALPSDPQAHLDLVFGHSDDTYYEDGYGHSDGYAAVVRGDGSLAVLRHRTGSTESRPLASAGSTPPVPGQWLHLRLDVSPTRIKWRRLDSGSSAAVIAQDSAYRGGYVHIGRSNTDPDASASFRRLTVA